MVFTGFVLAPILFAGGGLVCGALAAPFAGGYAVAYVWQHGRCPVRIVLASAAAPLLALVVFGQVSALFRGRWTALGLDAGGMLMLGGLFAFVTAAGLASREVAVRSGIIPR